MTGVKGEVLVDKDEVGENLEGRQDRNFSKAKRPWMRDLDVKGGDNSCYQGIRGKRCSKEMEKFKESINHVE